VHKTLWLETLTENFLPIAEGKEEMIMSRDYCMCSDGSVCCFTSRNRGCNTARLLQDRSGHIQDHELAQATMQINQVLDRVQANNQDPERELALLSVPEEDSDGTVLLLAWVRAGIGADSSWDDFKKILQ